MSVFQGGSAYNMARDVAEGYVLVTERTFKPYSPNDLSEFLFETDRYLREVRGNQAPPGDVEAVKKRQRKMQRLQQALTIANHVRSRRS
jgi:hypothetical protein